jgi:hypothetical protein
MEKRSGGILLNFYQNKSCQEFVVQNFGNRQ